VFDNALREADEEFLAERMTRRGEKTAGRPSRLRRVLEMERVGK